MIAMNELGVDHVVVLEDKDQLCRQLNNLIEEGGHQRFDRRLRRGQRGENTLPDLLLDDALERGHQVGEKARRVVVALIERAQSIL
jgi:hypothetical protein